MNNSFGFTGTRKGMLPEQMVAVSRYLRRASHLHHGDCVGADSEVHALGRSLGLYITIHPPEDSKARAYCSGDLTLPPKPYLIRNRSIVEMSDVLIAAPAQFTEVLRSGTWSTIRYARKIGKTVIVVFPDGSVESG